MDTMEEQFVSFETAKLVQKENFQEACYGYYDIDEGYEKGHAFCYHETQDDEDLKLLLAPTQSLLQSWLRSKNLIVYVTPMEVSVSNSKGIRFVWDICNYTGETLDSDNSPIGFLTYEEALEVGLQKALTL